MNNIYNVFNVKSDLQLNNILNKLDLTPSEMISMDEIISGYGSIKDKRKAILEMMALSSENNYKLCEKYFSQSSNVRKLKETVETTDAVTPSHLNMNQAIQLNSLFELASKKFQEVNCSQAFYQMLTQKLSKNFANAFFNTLKSCDESSELKYNPELTIDGKNFAETIFPLVNELTNFLNNCKAEKKEEVKESALTDTLNNLKYHISVTNNENNLKELKKQVSKLFNMAESTEDRNAIAEILSMINTKLSSIKPIVEECCDIDTLLEPFKTTVVNITVNDNGDFVDCEKETAKQSLKALASHINDTKDCCQENNIENMETISSLLSSLARYFHKKLCESQSYEKYSDVREELNDIKQDYLNNELDVYDATNAVDNLIGNKSEAEAIVDSWDDPSKHGLYGIDENMENAIDEVDSMIDDFGSYDDEYVRSICDDVAKSYGINVKKLYKEVTGRNYSVWDKDLDEDTVYDHSWYEVKGQKYPKRTKNGVEIKEGIKDWFKKDDRQYRIMYGKNGGWISKDMKYIKGDIMDALIVTGYKKAQKLCDKLESKPKNEKGLLHIEEIKHYPEEKDFEKTYEFLDIMNKFKNREITAEEIKKYLKDNKIHTNIDHYLMLYKPSKVNSDSEFYNQLMREPGMRNSEAEWIMKKNKSEKELDEDFKSTAKKVGRNIHKGLDKIHNATVRTGQKLGLGLSEKEMYDFFNEYLVYVFMFIYGKTTPDNDSFKGIYRNINGTDWNMENVHKFVMNMINNKNIMKQAKKDPDAVAKYMKYQLTHYGIDRKLIDRAWKTFEEEEKDRIDEMCSGGACCAGAVATIPSPVKPKTTKKKKKKSKVNEMALTMFKRHIIEGIDCQFDDDDNHYEYKDGYFYINGDIAKTTSKYYILESLDGQVELETLKGFNSEEMKLLEDIESSDKVGNKDEQNYSDNSNNPSNSNGNSQNSSNADTNINKDNLGDVKQNVTQDNDLTPQQRQLKKDTEKTLDQTMSGSNDVNVSVNQGMDNNNDQQTTNQSSGNIKYKLIGKDDSDKNNIKYIIQDPTTKETQVVDATKLRLEK